METTRTSGADPALPPRPCPWMRALVSGLADGSLRGLPRWLAERHVSACRPCSHAHRALTVLHGRLRGLADSPGTPDSLPTERNP